MFCGYLAVEMHVTVNYAYLTFGKLTVMNVKCHAKILIVLKSVTNGKQASAFF